MVRFRCPGCGSALNAKEELAGQTRRCPKCGTAVTVPYPGADGDELPDEVDAHVLPAIEEHLPFHQYPERLNRLFRYLVVDKKDVFATWTNNGQGWQVHASHGFVSASRNAELLPSQGDFQLVELHMETDEGAHRLTGVVVYQLARRWALTNLARGDDGICKSIEGPGKLSREQKTAVLEYLKRTYMRDVWADAEGVLDYLTNTDYHSPGTLSVT